MGLDGVELLFATEEAFQIAISDEEAIRCETPGLLADLVYSKLRKSKHEQCPSMHGFLVVRRTMMHCFALPRETIRPHSKLHELIPKKRRRVVWRNFLRILSDGQTISAPLKKPIWLATILIVVALIAFAVALIETGSHYASFLISLTLFAAIHASTTQLRVAFPRNFSLVKDLIRIVNTLDTAVWDRDKVYNRVKQIVVAQLGVKESDVHPDSHFVDDLGVGY